tara:strand:+ start:1100 stop:1717 length:618 start_codon:yes stop_codon:yes gene_type:complete
MLALAGCGNLKYLALKGTQVDNPPLAPVKVYVKEFPVTSKANVVDPNAALGDSDYGGGRSINALAEAGNAIMVISRSTRIEDLTRSLLREMRRDKLRVLTDLDRVSDLQNIREVENPFVLVPPEDDEAQLAISGSVLLLSKRVEQRFSQKSTSAAVEMVITDVATGKKISIPAVKAGINMNFNSKELEEAIAILITTTLAQKTLF